MTSQKLPILSRCLFICLFVASISLTACQSSLETFESEYPDQQLADFIENVTDAGNPIEYPADYIDSWSSSASNDSLSEDANGSGSDVDGVNG